jgi:hypothetical protein
MEGCSRADREDAGDGRPRAAARERLAAVRLSSD